VLDDLRFSTVMLYMHVQDVFGQVHTVKNSDCYPYMVGVLPFFGQKEGLPCRTSHLCPILCLCLSSMNHSKVPFQENNVSMTNSCQDPELAMSFAFVHHFEFNRQSNQRFQVEAELNI